VPLLGAVEKSARAGESAFVAAGDDLEQEIRPVTVDGQVQRHEILAGDTPIKTIHPDLTDLQKEVLRLLGVPASRYRRTPRTAS